MKIVIRPKDAQHKVKERLKDLMLYGDKLEIKNGNVEVRTPIDDQRLIGQVMNKLGNGERALIVYDGLNKCEVVERSQNGRNTVLDTVYDYPKNVEDRLRNKWDI